MVDDEIIKIDDNKVSITKFTPKTEIRTKNELEVMKIKLQAEIDEIDLALDVLK